MKNLMIVTGFLVFGAFLIAFVGEQNTTNENDEIVKTNEIEPMDYEEDKTQSYMDNEPPKNEPVEFLNVGGNTNPEEYRSNYYLHLAHIDAAAITYNTTFGNGGAPLGKEQFKTSLEGIKENLSAIKVTGEKKKDVQKAIYLTNEAIEAGAGKDDLILDDIHNVIHDLYEYYIQKDPDIKVDETGSPINGEYRIRN